MGLKVYAGIAEFSKAAKVDASVDASAADSNSGSGYGQASVLTIGNFDGVHRGHQALISRAVALAQKAKVPSVVLTFEPHPLAVLRPDLKLKRLFDSEDRREQIAALGVDALVIEPFSRAFSQMTPEKFLTETVVVPFQPRWLVVGYDFSFGANRAGSIDFLREHARRKDQFNFDLEVVSPVSTSIHGSQTTVSSTRIRQALEAGEPDTAFELLGRAYSVRGIVKKGAGRGRTIGFPTANLESTVDIVIKGGVYACEVLVRGALLPGLVNVGRNPTFNDSTLMNIEAHLPTYDGGKSGELYGEKIEIRFVERLRDEKKFAGVNELVAQIREDVARGLDILTKESSS